MLFIINLKHQRIASTINYIDMWFGWQLNIHTSLNLGVRWIVAQRDFINHNMRDRFWFLISKFASFLCRLAVASFRPKHKHIHSMHTVSIARGLSRSHIQASVNDRAPLTALFNWINKWRTLHTCNAPSHASMIKHSNVFALTLNCFDWNHIKHTSQFMEHFFLSAMISNAWNDEIICHLFVTGLNEQRPFAL